MMGDVPGDKTNDKGIWNGGTTRINKEEARIFRRMEDEYDTIFSEVHTRDELVKREKLMKQDKNYEEIQMNHQVSRKPLHELYTDIDYEEKTNISLMGGKGGPVEAIKSKNGESK